MASSSLSPSAAAPMRSSFSRGRSCGATVFIGASCCYTFPRVRRLLIGLLLLTAAGCSEPPQKEIDQAQSAIDAAHAAGADRYAAEEYAGATSTLQKAH